MECVICCKQARQFVECYNAECKFQACISCTQMYLLDQVHASCMSCKAGWEDSFLRATFSQGWIEKTYKQHKKKILLDMEKSYLAETVPYAQMYTKVKQLIAKSDVSARVVHDIKGHLDRVMKQPLRQDSPDAEFKRDCKYAKVYKQLHDAENEHSVILAHLHEASWKFNNSIEGGESAPASSFNFPCPEKACRGFLDKQFKCGLCATKVCKDCRVTLNAGAKHVCKKEDKESVEVILKETRACPKCQERIFRPEGCDHMFCTLCNTGFSWKTGKLISNSVNTNPYYYQWQGKQQKTSPTEINNEDRDVTSYTATYVTDVFQHLGIGDAMNGNYYGLMNYMLRFPFNIQSIIGELDQKDPEQFSPAVNRKYRIKYLVGEMDEQTLAMLAMKKYKQLEFQQQQHFHVQGLKTKLYGWMKKLCHLAWKHVEEHSITSFNYFELPIMKELETHLEEYNQQMIKLATLFKYTAAEVYKPSSMIFETVPYSYTYSKRNLKALHAEAKTVVSN